MAVITAIVTDIEGTTSSPSLLRDLLAPYARRELANYVRRERARPEVQRALEAARSLASEPAADEARTIAILERWIDEDRKATPLKTLQGLVWERGYRDGTLRAHLYPDVLPALVAWRQAGCALYVYSSGSLHAQQLFFAHTEHGDLRGLFDGYFDTETGAKNDAASYRAIARSIDVAPSSILFLSDAPSELEAALAAGMQVRGVRREDALNLEPFQAVRNFDEVRFAARTPESAPDASARRAALCALGRHCHERGWVYATSGNFSLRLDRARIAITASGRDKAALVEDDIVQVDLLGRSLEAQDKPSAETPLHCALYRRDREIGAVAHTHSVAATVLSRRALECATDDFPVLKVSGYEMAKALPGVRDHAREIRLPVVANSQDMAALQQAIDRALSHAPDAPGYLVAGHGLTTWASDLPSVKRHIEALEFLLACTLSH